MAIGIKMELQDCSSENDSPNDCDCGKHWWCEEFAPLGNHWVREDKIAMGQARLGVCFACSRKSLKKVGK